MYFKKMKRHCEDFIEKYNGYIQLLFLFTTFILGVILQKLNFQDEIVIAIEMLLIISGENIVINIKDSISQDKLNRLLLKIDKANGMLLTKEDRGYTDFPHIIGRATGDIYISGIASNGIWSAYIKEIEDALKRGCKMRLLISSEDCIENNARMYYGLNKGCSQRALNNYVTDVKTKINLTINTVKTNDILKHYLCNNKLEIRTLSVPFTTAFVGGNIFMENMEDREVKVTFYQYGCKDTKECPGFLLNNHEDRYWFPYFANQIKAQWKDATPIDFNDFCDISYISRTNIIN